MTTRLSFPVRLTSVGPRAIQVRVPVPALVPVRPADGSQATSHWATGRRESGGPATCRQATCRVWRHRAIRHQIMSHQIMSHRAISSRLTGRRPTWIAERTATGRLASQAVSGSPGTLASLPVISLPVISRWASSRPARRTWSPMATTLTIQMLATSKAARPQPTTRRHIPIGLASPSPITLSSRCSARPDLTRRGRHRRQRRSLTTRLAALAIDGAGAEYGSVPAPCS